MRKKLFAIVMSMTMVASFMPSLAFAAACNYPTVGNGDANYTWDEVQALLQSDDAKYVVDVVAPEHGKTGSFKLVCKEDFCGEKTAAKTITATCTNADNSLVYYSVEDFAAKLLEEKYFDNERQASQWVKAEKAKGVCQIKKQTCTKCGLLKNWNVGAGNEVMHEGFDPAKPCKAFDCTTCGTHFDGTANHIATAPTNDDEFEALDDKKVSEPTCGHGSGYKVACATCGQDTIWYHDETVGSYPSDMKSDAHNFGASVSGSEATKETKTGYEVLPGYAAKKQGVELPVGPGTPLTAADYNAAKFYKLVVIEDADTCTASKFGLKCSVCGKSVLDVAGTHDYEKTHLAATCDDHGWNKLVCKVCGDIDYESLEKTEPKLAHSYKVTKTNATCTTGEEYTVECTTCAYDDVDCDSAEHKLVFKLGQVHGATEIDNTKDTVTYAWSGLNGELKGSKVMEFVFAKNPSKVHKYGETELLKAATCTTDEVWGKKCTECGKVNHALAIVKPNTKLGHDYAEVKTAATCGAFGTISKTCTRCNDTVETARDTAAKPVVALGTKCSFDKWVVTKKATVFEEGVKSLECSVCGADGGSRTVIAKAKYAAPAVKAGKKSATVTVKATTDAVKYQISYKKAGGSYKTISAKVGKKTIKKLAKGKKYTFKVIAINAEGVKVASATKTVKVK